mmetsp:Transcript_10203/g.25635  ORF Transcript_10203/g.25635 Transcript_10203/m.25635 type:complete len:253 (+) Transcript_10203:2-760(+)
MMSPKETFRLALLFCPLWFFSNYSYNVGLAWTSVSSSSTIGTLSGFFTLVMGVMVGTEVFTVAKLGAVGLSMGGVALIASADMSTTSSSFRGDVMCLLSAVMYGTYTNFLKFHLTDDNSVDMCMFFGFVGLSTAVLISPLFFVLHLTGIETFEVPNSTTMQLLLLNGLIGTVLSDYLWARSVLLTTPLVATLAIALSIPLSVTADLWRGTAEFSTEYLIGTAVVLCGFIVVNYDEYWGEKDDSNAMALASQS